MLLAHKVRHFLREAVQTVVGRSGAKRAHAADLLKLFAVNPHRWCATPEYPESREHTWTCPVCGKTYRAFSPWDADFLDEPMWDRARKTWIKGSYGWTTRIEPPA